MRIEERPAVINAINQILERGNTAEIKVGKYGVFVTEVKKKIVINPPPSK